MLVCVCVYARVHFTNKENRSTLYSDAKNKTNTSIFFCHTETLRLANCPVMSYSRRIWYRNVQMSSKLYQVAESIENLVMCHGYTIIHRLLGAAGRLHVNKIDLGAGTKILRYN